MKLSICNVTENSVLYDISPEDDCVVMVPAKFNLFSLKPVKGHRLCVDLYKPTPGFFFGVAEFSDDAESCTLVFNEKSNKIGAYFILK